MPELTAAAAYGGERWSPRTAPLRDEIGELWARCGLRDEWGPLRALLLHRPEKAGLACRTTPVVELRLAAGGIGCLTGILERAPGA